MSTTNWWPCKIGSLPAVLCFRPSPTSTTSWATASNKVLTSGGGNTVSRFAYDGENAFADLNSSNALVNPDAST